MASPVLSFVSRLIPHLVRGGFARADEDLAAGHTYALDDVVAQLDRLEDEPSAGETVG